MIPTTPVNTSNNNRNYFAALALDEESYNEAHDDAACEQANQVTMQQSLHSDNSALSDSGASSHFIADGANVINKQIDRNPIIITLPDGATLQSTHTCNVNIPWLR